MSADRSWEDGEHDEAVVAYLRTLAADARAELPRPTAPPGLVVLLAGRPPAHRRPVRLRELVRGWAVAATVLSLLVLTAAARHDLPDTAQRAVSDAVQHIVPFSGPHTGHTRPGMLANRAEPGSVPGATAPSPVRVAASHTRAEVAPPVRGATTTPAAHPSSPWPAPERRSAVRRAAERRTAERRAAERRAAEHRAAERRAAERRAAERRAAERRAAQRRAAQRRAARPTTVRTAISGTRHGVTTDADTSTAGWPRPRHE